MNYVEILSIQMVNIADIFSLFISLIEDAANSLLNKRARVTSLKAAAGF